MEGQAKITDHAILNSFDLPGRNKTHPNGALVWNKTARNRSQNGKLLLLWTCILISQLMIKYDHLLIFTAVCDL